jgi:hypothetical protein
MESVSPLVTRYVAAAYPAEAQARVLETLASLREPPSESAWAEARERVQMGILLVAAGSPQNFESVAALAAQDWRDVLVAAGLGNADWQAVLQRAVALQLSQNEA